MLQYLQFLNILNLYNILRDGSLGKTEGNPERKTQGETAPGANPGQTHYQGLEPPSQQTLKSYLLVYRANLPHHLIFFFVINVS